MNSKVDIKGGHVFFFCPGCEEPHCIVYKEPFKPKQRWTFNGSEQAPTFTPSVLVNKDYLARRCHSFVTDGKIKFLNDCYHELKGKTVDLPEYPDTWRDE